MEERGIQVSRPPTKTMNPETQVQEKPETRYAVRNQVRRDAKETLTRRLIVPTHLSPLLMVLRNAFPEPNQARDESLELVIKAVAAYCDDWVPEDLPHALGKLVDFLDQYDPGDGL